MKVIEVVVLFFLVILFGVKLDLWLICFEDKKCVNFEICCGNICVDGLKVCKFVCQKQLDCDSLGNVKCVDGFCECVEELFCFNILVLYDRFMWNQFCRVDVDCF